jgi:putative ABC transport system ATP-binding protein
MTTLDTTTTITAARAVGLTKVYGSGPTAVTALDNVSVEFGRRQLTAIMGPSGSGKSTLLHLMAGLDSPTSGEVYIGDTEIARLDDAALTRLRRDRLGFVFQAFNLVPQLTAAENITLPLDLARTKPDPQWIDLVVQTLDLQDRLAHTPTELSGGQQQGVAIGRALVARPELVFADEPTGNLDSRAGTEVLRLLRLSVDDFDQTVVIVTHDPIAASYADRVLFLTDGRIVDELTSPSSEQVLDHLKTLEVA